MKERILIAGIGNIFLGDDAFGVEVVRRLAGTLPNSVRVIDFGIRGFDLAYALMDGYETTILVDVVHRDGPPGTLYTIEPDLQQLESARVEPVEAHGLEPVKVLGLVRALGGTFHRVLVVGCEPASLGNEDEDGGRMGLSEPVAAAADEAVCLIQSLAAKMLAEKQAETATDLTSSGNAVQTLETGGST
jgi:hydrogenase maturation protease